MDPKNLKTFMHAHRIRAKMYVKEKKLKHFGEKSSFMGKKLRKAEKLKEKLKKLKEKLKNSLSGKALFWYMPKICQKKTPVISG